MRIACCLGASRRSLKPNLQSRFCSNPTTRRCHVGSNTLNCCWSPTKCSMWTESASLSSPRQFPSTPLLTRRQMLQRMCAGFGMVGLAGLLGPESLLAFADDRAPHFAPRAKRVIFLFLNGGPSHVDTFDPKPALMKYEGQQPSGDHYKITKGTGFMPSPLEFRKCGRSGIEVSETLPNLGRIIDDCCGIRSMKTDVPNHEPALLQMHTGNVQPIRPSMGSWLLYGLGAANRNLPGYVVLRPTAKIVVGPALWSNSFLPAEFQATSVITSDMRVDKLVANVRNPKLTLDQQREQLDLLGQLNAMHLKKRNGDAELEGQIKAMETAFHMQSQAMKTFDISREPEHTRNLYADTPFARSGFLARRLGRSRPRLLTVYYVSHGNQPWDTHANILHLLGIDHERLTYRYAGRDFRLTDVHGRVVKEIVA